MTQDGIWHTKHDQGGGSHCQRESNKNKTGLFPWSVFSLYTTGTCAQTILGQA